AAASRPALPENTEENAMTAVETLKKITEKATGWARPGQDALAKLNGRGNHTRTGSRTMASSPIIRAGRW
ncbi:MAG: hypothetical protein WBQ20_07975, partial [Methyloceanibacter sp.]